MGIKFAGDVILHGNFAEITETKPESYEEEYKMYVPYFFKGRIKIGKVTCTCEKVLECYMSYYGYDWYHEDNCELMKLVEKKPQLTNLPCYQNISLIAQSE